MRKDITIYRLKKYLLFRSETIQRKRTRWLGFVVGGSEGAGSNPLYQIFFALIFYGRLTNCTWVFCQIFEKFRKFLKFVLAEQYGGGQVNGEAIATTSAVNLSLKFPSS